MNTKDDFKLLTLIRRLELWIKEKAKYLLSLCERNSYKAGEKRRGPIR
jgi:hypothetical protein